MKRTLYLSRTIRETRELVVKLDDALLGDGDDDEAVEFLLRSGYVDTLGGWHVSEPTAVEVYDQHPVGPLTSATVKVTGTTPGTFRYEVLP